MIKGIDESIIKQWIEDSLHSNTHVLAAGYQGKTLLFDDASPPVVVKAPHGKGLVKYIHTLMLRHEHRVYQQLSGFEGAPECYGLIDNKYLALEYVKGQPIRQKRPANDERFFKKLFELVEQMHRLGVAHMDLKKKDNLLVGTDDRPYIIDFGTAIITKSGFHPINAYLFSLARRFDYNAWIKHKYHNRNRISDDDAIYYQRTFIERLSSFIKKTCTRIKPLKRQS